MKQIVIHGFKKQAQTANKPNIAKDSASSISFFRGLYGLCEGEIFGLADGGKSIKLDDTPLINATGEPNFTDEKGQAQVQFDFRTGTLDQVPIKGFPAVENEIPINSKVAHTAPFVRSINNAQLSAIRIRVSFDALRTQNENGDIAGAKVEYAIDLQTDGGAWIQMLVAVVDDKTSAKYERSHRIDLPTGKAWTVRVRRLTKDSISDFVSDTMYVSALTEIIDAKLAYPCTALLGLTYDATRFANIAKIAIRLKGKIIQVPSNYNPNSRTYHGLWDGTFKLAYSNNPAWVFYDLCTHKRYGLGERLSGMVDKWRLYQIGQYCDELVDDGKGGQEPRFTVNVYIQKADDAYRVLQNLASVFRGLSFWDGQNIIVDSDTPKEAVYTFSPANVVGGEFAYTGTRARDRHTLAKVAWDNPDNAFNTEYELIPDEEAIARYGVKVLDIAAFGCTSKGQAQRAGLWALKAEQLETQTVSFKTGLQGFIPQVGQVINIADNVFAGRAISGKIVAVADNQKTITLDRVAGKVGDTLTVNGTNGVQSAKIVSVRDTVLTLDKPINAHSEHIWAIISDDLKLKQFRILTIAQNDDATFDITALEYNAQKYAVVDNGAIVTPQPYTVLKATPITAPNSVTLTASTRTVQGQAVTTLTINWEQVQGAAAYIVKWRKDDGNWQTLPKVSGQSVDIEGIYTGNYTAQVQAVDAFDNESLATTSQLTPITGKIGKPPRLASLIAQGKLFAMDLVWGFNKGSDDTNFTEIQVSPDGRSNITTLGTFAYPTNKHEITGLQGGLTQFYRARIVDKLGNTSDWTAWVRGITDNQAEKVLNLISGQINESHLHQTLSTPIAKIGGLETDLNGVKTQLPTLRNDIANAKTSLQSAIDAVNAQLPNLNNQIATLNGKATNLQNELNTAKNTLQTAVNNITTERNRISTAIRDIGTLQSANNAKTQEIANLTNTVGSHTSSIRELGVTTGDLSQKYSQLKTATDTANSEITAIKQTQSGTATSIERLGAKFDNLAVGGENLLRGTASPKLGSGAWQTATFRKSGDGTLEAVTVIDSPIKDVAMGLKLVPSRLDNFGVGFAQDQYALELGDYTYSFWVNGVAGDRIKVQPFWASQNQSVPATTITLKGGWEYVSFTGRNTVGGISQSIGYVYLKPVNLGNTATIVAPMLEKATIASAWQPSRFDVQAELDGKASTANLETLRQTLTSADTALSQQITAMDTAYKSADRQLTANLASETTARTSADNALGQRIDTLQTDYNSNKASVANQLKTLSDKDTATASQISQLTANVSTAQNTANNALNRANTANSSITAEQKARADADSSLASQISSLDTAYKSADSQLSTRITTAQQTATNAQNAVASVQSELTAKFDALKVGGRNYFKKSSVVANLRNTATATKTTDNGIIINATNANPSLTRINRVIDEVADWTVSFEAKANTPCSLFVDICDQNRTIHQLTTEFKKYITIGRPARIDNTYHFVDIETQAVATIEIKNIKIEKGNIATDYTPAPEDTQSQLDEKVSTASLNEFKQTSANADTALGERISAIDTAYKQADTATNAKLANAEKAISDNNTALSQQITALDTAYKSADNNLTARLAREETARATGDTTNSQAIRTLESTVNGIGGRVGTSESKIASLERTTSDTNQALATAQNQLNARFDNLAVGGRNLLLNTQNPTATQRPRFKTTNAGAWRGNLSFDGGITRMTRSVESGELLYRLVAPNITNMYDLEFGTYTFSGKVRTNSTNLIIQTSYHNGTRWNDTSTGNIASENWTDFKVTITIPDTARGWYVGIREMSNTIGNWFEFKELKLEKGSIPTDYTPAPEDTQSQLDEKASTATLDEFKRTQAQKDTATASQISQLTANVTTAQNTANTANSKADTATTKADNAQNTANNALTRANTANSAITAEQKARADADSSLASQISSLDTAYKSADSQLSTRITTAQQTATNAQNAVATAQSELNARFDNLKIGGRNLILGSQVSRTTHGTTALAISQNIDFGTVTHLVLSCDVRFANAVRATTQGARWFRIGAEIRLVWTDGTSGWYGAWRSNVANGTGFDGRVEHKIIIPTGKTLKAIDNAKIQIWDITGENMLVKNPKLELGTIATDWTPAPEDVNVDLSPYATNSSLNEFKQAQAQKDTATASKLSQLESTLGTKAGTTALDSLSTKVNQVDGKITAEAQKVSALQTTVNGQTSSIQQHAQTLNGLSAQWTLKVQSGNIVSGIGLASNNGVSDFAIRADKFYVAPPTGTGKGDTPFTVLTSPQVINGVRVPAGTYIKSAFIQDGSITNAKLANASIDNAKIANASIDSVKIRNGAVGSLQLQDGAVTSAKIGHLAVDTLNIADEAVIVPRALSAGFKEWDRHIENEVIFSATMDSKQSPVVINFYAHLSGATISDYYNAGNTPPRINITATHIGSGEKEYVFGYDEKASLSLSNGASLGGANYFSGGDDNHYFNSGGTNHYWGKGVIISRNTLLFLPKYAGEYRFELTITLKDGQKHTRARLYEASILLMAVKR